MAGFSAGNIAARKPHIGRQKFFPQRFASGTGQARRVIGIRYPNFVGEQSADILSVLMNGGCDDVGRPLARQLDDVFSQVGFGNIDAVFKQGRVQPDLLAHHGFAFDRQLNVVPVGNLQAIFPG